jgi:hypothetical protein
MNGLHKLQIKVDGKRPSDADKFFVGAVKFSHDLFFNQFDTGDLGPTKVVVNLCSDFITTVEDVQKRTYTGSNRSYSVERLGGEVAGKCIQMNQDATSFEILYNRKAWLESNGGDLAFISNSRLVMHELAHALIDRVRHKSGAMEGVIIPSELPSETARSLARIVAEEFWVDWITGTAIGAMGTATNENGEIRPIGPQDLYGGPMYVPQIEEIIDQHVYPGWLETVESYRNYRLTIGDMWSKLVDQAGQIFTLLAHAEAEQLFLDAAGPLNDCSNHRAVELYLHPVWSPLSNLMKKRPLMPSVSTFKETEREIIATGEDVLIKMWGKLGLTFDERADRTFALWVDEPKK